MHADVEEHVDRFLAPVGVHHRLARVCGRMADAAEPPGPPRESLTATVDWLTGPLVDPRTLALHRRIGGDRSNAGVLQPAEEDLLLSTAYLRVEHEMRSPDDRLQDRLRNVDRGMVEGWQALHRVEADFAGELLVESGLRQARDPVFAARLREAEVALEWLYPRVGELATRLRDVSSRERFDAFALGGKAARQQREFDAAKVAVAAAAALVLGIAVGASKAQQ
jgi:hypothetical protein